MTDIAPGGSTFSRRALIAATIGTAVVLAAITLVVAAEVFLTLFAGMLLAVFLNGLTHRVARLLGTSYGRTLGGIVVLAIAVIIGGAWLAAPQVVRQSGELADALTMAVQNLQERLKDYPRLRDALPVEVTSEGRLTSKVPSMATAQRLVMSTVEVVTTAVVILFIGLYGAADPDLYRRGFLRLVPVRNRPRANTVLQESARTLWEWLIGQLISMAIIGVCTAIGLWLLGIPLPFALAVLTALLTFIPNIGPILSVIPPSLLALQQGPTQALYVVAFYTGLQFVESYFVTPLIQQYEVSLPPALTIGVQVLLGFLAGILGLLVATPLAALVMTLVSMLYIGDVLGDREPERELAAD